MSAIVSDSRHTRLLEDVNEACGCFTASAASPSACLIGPSQQRHAFSYSRTTKDTRCAGDHAFFTSASTHRPPQQVLEGANPGRVLEASTIEPYMKVLAAYIASAASPWVHAPRTKQAASAPPDALDCLTPSCCANPTSWSSATLYLTMLLSNAFTIRHCCLHPA